MEGGTPDNRRAVYVEKRFERFIADRYNLPTYMQKDGDGNSWWRKKHEMFWGNQICTYGEPNYGESDWCADKQAFCDEFGYGECYGDDASDGEFDDEEYDM